MPALSRDPGPRLNSAHMHRRTLALLIVVVFAVSAVGLAYEAQAPAQAYKLSVFPDRVSGDAIAGQRVVFLVTVAANGTGQARDVKITATAPLSAVTVTPESLSPGEVGEVAVIP